MKPLHVDLSNKIHFNSYIAKKSEISFAVSFYSVQDCRLLLWMFGMETKKLRLPTFRNSLQMLVISGKYKKRGTKQERKL